MSATRTATVSNHMVPMAELLSRLLTVAVPALDMTARKQLAKGLLAVPRRGRRRRQRREMSIAKLCKLYCEHADNYYRRSDGCRTQESNTVRHALKPLRQMFGRKPVSSIGPLRLKEVRDAMVALGWYRKTVNSQIGRIKRMYKWGVANELVPSNVYHALEAVDGLRVGRTTAPESPPVKPASEPLIEAVFPFVSAQVQAMVKLQLTTGMRPGEVVIMRTCDIDTSVQPWLYRPSRHKTEHHHHERVVFLGPKCQEVLLPFLKPQQPQAFLFAPKEAERERRRRVHTRRKTPMSCGNVPGSNKKRHPKRPPGVRYETQSYGRAVSRACELAFPVPDGLDPEQTKQWRRNHHWHPNQLRHNAATRLRKEFGLDVAQVVLGHKTLSVTQVYAEKDVASAQQVMLKAG